MSSVLWVCHSQVAAAHDHTFFINKRGHSWGGGSNVYGQLSLKMPHRERENALFPCLVDAGSMQNNIEGLGCTFVLRVATAQFHTLFVTRAGFVYHTGEGKHGCGVRPPQVVDTASAKPYRVASGCKYVAMNVLVRVLMCGQPNRSIWLVGV